jgi:hypothetical protein
MKTVASKKKLKFNLVKQDFNNENMIVFYNSNNSVRMVMPISDTEEILHYLHENKYIGLTDVIMGSVDLVEADTNTVFYNIDKLAAYATEKLGGI